MTDPEVQTQERRAGVPHVTANNHVIIVEEQRLLHHRCSECGRLSIPHTADQCPGALEICPACLAVGWVDAGGAVLAACLLAGGIACMWDVSTVPEHRRNGYGACLTRAGLDDAKRRGYRYASLNSSSAGYAMYRSLGFNVEVEIPEYHWTPQRERERA